MKRKQAITKIPCRVCHQETKHAVLAKHETSDVTEVEGYGEVSWRDIYEMLECRGCETVTLRHTHVFSEDPDIDVRYYPPSVSRPMPPWKNKLKDHKLRSVVEEVYAALGTDCRRLATMGARTVVDMVMTDKVGDV